VTLPDPYTRAAIYMLLAMAVFDLAIFDILARVWIFAAGGTVIALNWLDTRRHGITLVGRIPPKWNTRLNRRLNWMGSGFAILSALAVAWKLLR
jgi:hypothetical protein